MPSKDKKKMNGDQSGKFSRGPSTKRIRDLVNVARAMGLTYLRAGEVEFHLGEAPRKPNAIDNELKNDESLNEVMPSDEEMLMHSSPFYQPDPKDTSPKRSKL